MLQPNAPTTQSGIPTNFKQAFTYQETHPLVLSLILLKEMGPQFLAWEPETIWDEVRYTFGTTVSELNKQKIQAARSVYVADGAGEKWEVFEKVAAGLVGNAPRLDTMQRPTPGRAHIALDIIASIRSEKYVRPEVYKYCAAVLADHGMLYGPGALEPANQYLKNIDKAVQQQVRSAVLRGTAPNIIGDTTLQVQTMKALSVKDFATSIKDTLGKQLRTLGL